MKKRRGRRGTPPTIGPEETDRLSNCSRTVRNPITTNTQEKWASRRVSDGQLARAQSREKRQRPRAFAHEIPNRAHGRTGEDGIVATTEPRVDGAAAMNRARIGVGLLVAVIVIGGLGVVADTGFGPAAVEPEPEPDSTAGGGSTADSGSEIDSDSGEFPATEADGDDEPFAFSIEEIETCGETCREVTAAVENTQTESTEEVTVETRIFAGENSTEELVWETTEEVGTLAAGESYTSTERVDLSLGEAYAIEQADGWITIQTTIDADDERVTLSESRQVG